jgi:hypothetical protein
MSNIQKPYHSSGNTQSDDQRSGSQYRSPLCTCNLAPKRRSLTLHVERLFLPLLAGSSPPPPRGVKFPFHNRHAAPSPSPGVPESSVTCTVLRMGSSPPYRPTARRSPGRDSGASSVSISTTILTLCMPLLGGGKSQPHGGPPLENKFPPPRHLRQGELPQLPIPTPARQEGSPRRKPKTTKPPTTTAITRTTSDNPHCIPSDERYGAQPRSVMRDPVPPEPAPSPHRSRACTLF